MPRRNALDAFITLYTPDLYHVMKQTTMKNNVIPAAIVPLGVDLGEPCP